MKEIAYGFPFDKLPKIGAFPLPIFQRAVDEVVKAHKVPLKLAIYSVLAAAGALAQLRFAVKKPAGGISPIGMYVLAQGLSGERKTKVDQCYFEALRGANRALRDGHLGDAEAYKVRERIWKRKEKAIMASLDQALKSGNETQDIESSLIRHEKERPTQPREVKLVFKDVNIAAIKKSLSQSPNATLLSSDGKKVLNEFLLQNDAAMNQFWSGEEDSKDRVTSRSYSLVGVGFNFSVMIQRDALARIMANKGKDGMESGFFARTIFVDVGSTLGGRMIDIGDTAIPNLDAYNRRARCLAEEYIDALISGRWERKVLSFTPEAFHAWINYFNYVESNIKKGGRYEKTGDHASKLADNVARAAAALHVLEGFEGDIGLECLMCAIALCDEASRDYMTHLAPKDEDESNAVKLKEWLMKKYVCKRTTTTWIDAAIPANFIPNEMRGRGAREKIDRYLEILERDEYLTVWPAGSGGRKRAAIELRMTKSGESRSKGAHPFVSTPTYP